MNIFLSPLTEGTKVENYGLTFTFGCRHIAHSPAVMAFKNILPLHKKDEDAEEKHHHHHEHRQRANGHIVPKQSTQTKRQRGLTSKWRNELVAMTAEFCGTFLFLFFAFGGTQVANTAALFSDATTARQQGNSLTQAPNTSVLLYISLIFGFSLMVNVWVFFRVRRVHPSSCIC